MWDRTGRARGTGQAGHVEHNGQGVWDVTGEARWWGTWDTMGKAHGSPDEGVWDAKNMVVCECGTGNSKADEYRAEWAMHASCTDHGRYKSPHNSCRLAGTPP